MGISRFIISLLCSPWIIQRTVVSVSKNSKLEYVIHMGWSRLPIASDNTYAYYGTTVRVYSSSTHIIPYHVNLSSSTEMLMYAAIWTTPSSNTEPNSLGNNVSPNRKFPMHCWFLPWGYDHPDLLPLFNSKTQFVARHAPAALGGRELVKWSLPSLYTCSQAYGYD